MYQPLDTAGPVPVLVYEGTNRQTCAVAWLGGHTNREEIVKRVSPLTYVRSGLPPILTIHGDADTVVPYTNAVRLQEALNKAGIHNQLHTVPGGSVEASAARNG